MGGCFCCMSEDAQIKAVMEKLEVDRVANATHGYTKFWVGRIMVTNDALIAPVSGKQCAYYEVRCEEYCKHYREDHETGHREAYWTWDHRFTEEKSSDFLLADPQGTPAFVPGSKYKTKFYSVIDESDQDRGRHNRGIKGFFTGDMGRRDTIEAMLRRHGQQSTFGGDDKGQFRYYESSFTVNELVAILGTAQPYVHQGISMTILTPPNSSILTTEYFEANEWTSNEIKSWEALTSQPSVIGSDDPKYFKGISVDDIPFSYSPFSFCAPVYYGNHQPPQMMIQQQGQPMMQQPMMMQQQGQPMMQQQGQPMMQQQGQPMMQQPMMMQQQGQPMMQQPMMMQQQGQPMMQQQGQQMMQQPMMMQQQGQPMMQQQNYGPSTVAPEEQQQQQPGIIPTVGVVPTIGPSTVVPM